MLALSLEILVKTSCFYSPSGYQGQRLPFLLGFLNDHRYFQKSHQDLQMEVRKDNILIETIAASDSYSERFKQSIL